MNVLSLFTGVGGFDLGFQQAGHRIVGMCESDSQARTILERHWPGLPLSHDITTLNGDWLEAHHLHREPAKRGSRDRHTGSSPGPTRRQADSPPVELVCGGFPCQDLSVAGKRAGLAGERSGLFFDALRVTDLVLEPGGWLLLENVPGLLSSNGGRDFAVVLASLAELGFHDIAWRVLDSQFFGVPQRRRRVFILARRSRGDRAKQVLLEPEGSSRDSPSSDETRKTTSSTITESVAGPLGARLRNDLDGHGTYVVPAVTSKWAKGSGGPAGDECQNLVPTLTAANNPSRSPQSSEVTAQIEAVASANAGVRRLTPLVKVSDPNDRLQGYADAPKTHTGEILRCLRDEAGTEAFAEWGLGILAALQPSPLLRQRVHEDRIPAETETTQARRQDGPVSREQPEGGWTLRALWRTGRTRCSPPGRESAEQRVEELGAHLSQLPHPASPTEEILLGLWQASEGVGVLRQALSTVQEMGQPLDRKTESALAASSGIRLEGGPGFGVRRLTPV